MNPSNGTPVDQALTAMTKALMVALAYLSAFLAFIDTGLHRGLTRLGVPPNLQMLLILVADVVLLIAVFRAFGGLARVFAIIFLILLLLHVAAPGLGV